MLTGQRLFSGPTVGATLAQVLEREPDQSRLSTTTPVAIKRLVRRCLVKKPEGATSAYRRCADRNQRSAVCAVAGSHHGRDDAANVAGWRRTLPWVAAVITTAVVAGVVGWRAQPELPARTPARFTIGTLPPGFGLICNHPEVAISPDGTRIRERGLATLPRAQRLLDPLTSPSALRPRPSVGRKEGVTRCSRPMASRSLSSTRRTPR